MKRLAVLFLRVSIWIVIIRSCAFGQGTDFPNCGELQEGTRHRIESYLSARLVAGEHLVPSIKSVELVGRSCYRKLVVALPGATSEVVLYLSPDSRFLTSTLYDLTVDPDQEVARIAENVSTVLMRDKSPRLVGSDPRITVVEFVDFQCPYCKRLAGWYSDLTESLRAQTTLVFKQLPLEQHGWAYTAAIYALCANEQSSAAFNDVAGVFFQKQPDITQENIKTILWTGLAMSNNVNRQQLEMCAAGPEAPKTIQRDVTLAKQLNITSTPTLFINGRRVLRVASAEDLQHLLEAALADVAKTRNSAALVRR